MKNRSKALLLFSGVAALSVVAVALSTNSTLNFNDVRATSSPVNLNSAALKTIALEDIDLKGVEGEYDKKFRIPLADNKYIDGAIVFQDCGSQFTGATLGDAFGIDNTASSTANAYNFQILFSLDNTSSISVDMTENASTGDGSVYTLFQLKYGNFGGADFYDNIKNNYDKVTCTQSSSGNYYDVATAKYLKLDEGTRDNFTNHSLSQTDRTVVALQVTYGVSDESGVHGIDYWVQPYQWINFTLDNLTISYTCK